MFNFQFSIFNFLPALIAAAIFATIFLLSNGPSNAEEPAPPQKQYPILSSCSGSDIFSQDWKLITMVDDQDRVDDWIDQYHETVSKIVEEHLKTPKVECASETARERPSDQLKDIAAQLPPWKDPEDLKHLSELDMSAVLLEHLRLYECSLKEEQFHLGYRVARDISLVSQYIELLNIWDNEFTERKVKIERELQEARTALDRTLAVIGSIDRLKPLDTDIECLQRSSLDMRNVLGLAADVSACLPRAWDARGSLRDVAEKKPESEGTSSSETP